MTTRKTLKDFLKNNDYPKEIDSDDGFGEGMIRYNLSDNDETVTNKTVFNRGEDDLKNNIKQTLSSYIKYIVDNAANIYGPNNTNLNTTGIEEKSTYYARGDALPISNPDYDVYITNENAPQLDKLSNSDYLETNQYLDKTGGDAEKSGHEVLKKVSENATGLDQSGNATPFKFYNHDTVLAATQKMLFDNNRFGNLPTKNNFTGNKDLSAEDFEENTEIDEGSLLIENTFGEHTKENKIKLDKLKSLGESLLYRVSGFDITNRNDGGKRSNDSTSISDNIDLGYEGSRFDKDGINLENSNSYRSKYSHGSVFDSLANSLRDGKGEFFNQNTETFGQTYNSNYHFFGKNIKIQKIQVILALRAVFKLYQETYKELIKGLMSDFDETESIVKEKTNVSGGKPFLLGTSSKDTLLNVQLYAEKVLVRTIFPYNKCVERGLKVCFGDIKEYGKGTVEVADGTGIKGTGFWLAVASSVLKRADSDLRILLELEAAGLNSNLVDYLEVRIKAYQSDPVLRFFNTMATIGDISFKAFQGKGTTTAINNIRRPLDPDALPDEPGNRVGKSRKRKGNRTGQLAWGQNEVPSAYLLPFNVVLAGIKLDRGPGSVNPFRGIVGSELVENYYMGLDTIGSGNRIPDAAVKGIEDRLDAEYVPLYIQDLRTNEIIAFHAFITSLDDTYNTNYTSSGGYGRLDQVKIFDNTTRTINISFHLVATSKEDFNAMWVKINKLLTLIYPQWTQGTRVADEFGNVFIQPHSQVMGATPVVRLRVGDVIKSNYSKFNLARVFGIGDVGVFAKKYSAGGGKKAEKAEAAAVQDTGTVAAETTAAAQAALLSTNIANAKLQDATQINLVKALMAIYGSPLQHINSLKDKALESKALSQKSTMAELGTAAVDQIDNVAAEFLKNGFVSPVASLTTFYQIQDPALASVSNGFLEQTPNISDFFDQAIGGIRLGYVPYTTTLLLKGNMHSGYLRDTGKGRVYTQRPIRVMITGFANIKSNINRDSTITNRKLNSQTDNRTAYTVKIVDGTLLGELSFDDQIIVYHEDLIPLPSAIFFNTIAASLMSTLASGPGAIAGIVEENVSEAVSGLGLGSAVGEVADAMFASGETRFMDSEHNPFVKAYETTRGRGVAGVIGGLSFKWYDENTPWETDYNSRAPKGCTISFKLDVIHDIPPGIDHTGYNRAPLYNVGDVMKEFSGDVYDDDGTGAAYRYKKGTTVTTNYNEEE